MQRHPLAGPQKPAQRATDGRTRGTPGEPGSTITTDHDEGAEPVPADHPVDEEAERDDVADEHPHVDDGEGDGEGDDAPKLLTVREACERSGIGEKALRRRIERGRVRTTRGSDGRVMVLVADIPELADGGNRGGIVRQGGNSGATQGKLIAEFIDQLKEQAEEIGKLKALTAGAAHEVEEARRLRDQIIELRVQAQATDELRARAQEADALRVRVAELEAQVNRPRGLRRLLGG